VEIRVDLAELSLSFKEFADRVDCNNVGRDQQQFEGDGFRKTQSLMYLQVKSPPLLQRTTLTASSLKLYHFHRANNVYAVL